MNKTSQKTEQQAETRLALMLDLLDSKYNDDKQRDIEPLTGTPEWFAWSDRDFKLFQEWSTARLDLMAKAREAKQRREYNRKKAHESYLRKKESADKKD